MLGIRQCNPDYIGKRLDFIGVGYPKTGNTWTRVMLGKYIQSIHTLEHLPLYDMAEANIALRSNKSIPIGYFTHEPLRWNNQNAQDIEYENVIAPFRDQKVIFLTRHPLDTLVSHFMHAKFKVPLNPYSGTLIEFVLDPIHGLDKHLKFHQLWAAHYHDTKGFLLWRYEDVCADPAGKLEELLGFIGEKINPASITEAVEFASFNNMKAMELSGQKLIYQSSGFNAFGDGPRDDPNSFHVRKGEVGGYKNELSPEFVIQLEQRIKTEMPEFFGYS